MWTGRRLLCLVCEMINGKRRQTKPPPKLKPAVDTKELEARMRKLSKIRA